MNAMKRSSALSSGETYARASVVDSDSECEDMPKLEGEEETESGEDCIVCGEPSSVDSRGSSGHHYVSGVTAGAESVEVKLGKRTMIGDSLVYQGEELVVDPDEGVLVPVTRTGAGTSTSDQCEAAMSSQECDLEVAPGLWDTNGKEGMVLLSNLTEEAVTLNRGSVVGAVVKVAAQRRVCLNCGFSDTDAWTVRGKKKCSSCNTEKPGGSSSCRSCAAPPDKVKVFSYAGCDVCRAEAAERKNSRAISVGMFAVAALGLGSVVNTIERPVYHIVEETGIVDRITELDSPTEYYYDALRKDMEARHPKVDVHFMDHLMSTEPFLHRSIVSGFSFGAEKAQLAVTEGKLLGNVISRTGSKPDPERVGGY